MLHGQNVPGWADAQVERIGRLQGCKVGYFRHNGGGLACGGTGTSEIGD